MFVFDEQKQFTKFQGVGLHVFALGGQVFMGRFLLEGFFSDGILHFAGVCTAIQQTGGAASRSNSLGWFIASIVLADNVEHGQATEGFACTRVALHVGKDTFWNRDDT